MTVKSPLGRVLGLGSAGKGTDHWWMQRLTAVALVPLGLWFVISMTVTLVAAPAHDHATIFAWIAHPVNAVLLVLLALTLVYHSKLGVQVVVEDYVHGAPKVVTLILSNFLHAVLAVAAVFAVLRIAFGSPQ